MLSSFTRDLADDQRQVEEAFAERGEGKALRVRIQPQLLRNAKVKHRGTQYMVWKDVSWTLDCASPEEVLGVRDALAVFFRALAAMGPAALIRLLNTAQKQAGVA